MYQGHGKNTGTVKWSAPLGRCRGRTAGVQAAIAVAGQRCGHRLLQQRRDHIAGQVLDHGGSGHVFHGGGLEVGGAGQMMLQRLEQRTHPRLFPRPLARTLHLRGHVAAGCAQFASPGGRLSAVSQLGQMCFQAECDQRRGHTPRGLGQRHRPLRTRNRHRPAPAWPVGGAAH